MKDERSLIDDNGNKINDDAIMMDDGASLMNAD